MTLSELQVRSWVWFGICFLEWNESISITCVFFGFFPPLFGAGWCGKRIGQQIGKDVEVVDLVQFWGAIYPYIYIYPGIIRCLDLLRNSTTICEYMPVYLSLPIHNYIRIREDENMMMHPRERTQARPSKYERICSLSTFSNKKWMLSIYLIYSYFLWINSRGPVWGIQALKSLFLPRCKVSLLGLFLAHVSSSLHQSKSNKITML